jgi:hypothetical protein
MRVEILGRYSEAIEILYKENFFDFDSLADVLKLSLTLLPERMSLIKSVQWKPTAFAPHYLNNTPWLRCRKSESSMYCLGCCCVACVSENIS